MICIVDFYTPERVLVYSLEFPTRDDAECAFDADDVWDRVPGGRTDDLDAEYRAATKENTR